MSTKRIAPYGAWKSPISSDLIVGGSISLGGVALDGQDVYWLEGRPAEGGRMVLVRREPDGVITDVTPQGYYVRTRVHEYGGAAFLVTGGVVYFTNFTDQRLYRQPIGHAPEPLTPENGKRYADMILDAPRNRLICVCEDHSAGGEPVNSIAAVALDGSGTIQTLVSGNDFYAAPRLSPDGAQLAYLTWNHPNMPWDGTELYVASVPADGSLGAAQLVAGGKAESVTEPVWSPDGTLYFVSDRSNWWNLYRWTGGQNEALQPMAAEFGGPQWVFGAAHYAFETPDRLICAYTQGGQWYLARLDLTTKTLTPIETPYSYIAGVVVGGDRVVMLAGGPTAPMSVVQFDMDMARQAVLRRANNVALDPEYISVPQAVEFPTENGLTAHGFFYPPTNKDYLAPRGEKPPLLVESHGGPTAATVNVFNLQIQYWTSRGVAVLDVNYGGSTGYGRDYRQRLNGQWGVVDVMDCINGAKYLADQGLVDSNRLMITGGSAGGYTTLSALTFHDVFQAGTSHFGVSDIAALARDTHKFESRYMDSLVGPYPASEALYQARSPLFHTDQLRVPVAFFQGLEDPVVPPNQAEMMVNALRQKGVPVAYVAFPGESHGFRKAENIKRALDGEFYFYARVFGYTPADQIEPLPIDNLG